MFIRLVPIEDGGNGVGATCPVLRVRGVRGTSKARATLRANGRRTQTPRTRTRAIALYRSDDPGRKDGHPGGRWFAGLPGAASVRKHGGELGLGANARSTVTIAPMRPGCKHYTALHWVFRYLRDIHRWPGANLGGSGRMQTTPTGSSSWWLCVTVPTPNITHGA